MLCSSEAENARLSIPAEPSAEDSQLCLVNRGMEVWVGVSRVRDGWVEVDVEGGVCLCVARALGKPCLLVEKGGRPDIGLPLWQHCSAPPTSLPTALPTASLNGYFVAGLAATLRQVARSVGRRDVLGFRESCLAAPAEVSLWTRYCEVEVVNSSRNTQHLPAELATLEHCLATPARVHNSSKLRHHRPDSDPRAFLEGPDPSLADLMVAAAVTIVIRTISCDQISSLLPLSLAWLERVRAVEGIGEALDGLTGVHPVREVDGWPPGVTPHSAPSLHRQSHRKKHFTHPNLVESSLVAVSDVELLEYMEGWWWDVPLEAETLSLPNVPGERLERKAHQIANIAKAVLKIAKEGDVIVDLCCGSGHVGIVLAGLLPECTIILLDNKEASLARARLVAETFSNISVVQANIDYFTAPFQIGVALHACGVASDLVIEKCLSQRASIVLCPCCYGSIQRNHTVSYPRSTEFKARLDEAGFLVVGHAADTEGSDLGRKAMQAVDSDRCLYLAERGYSPSLAKLQPPDCTTRNNIIVATPT